MTKLHIYLFRHGQTTYNRDGIFTGWNNPKLTKLGVKQAKAMGGQLKNKKIDLAIHSGLTRAKDTLAQVLKHHPECIKVVVDKRMIERSYGKLAGMSHLAIKKKYGMTNFEKWHRGYNTPPPQGESFADVERRVKPFISDLIKMMKREKLNVAISAHGNSIRLFRKIMEKSSIKETVSWTIPYDKYFHYTIEV